VNARDGARATRRRIATAALVVFAANLYPPLLALYEEGTLGAFHFLAADAFYYLAIAERSQGFPGYSFDGLYPTNGFHPLWGWSWTGLFALLHPTREAAIVAVHCAGALMVATGAALLAASIARLTGRFVLALVAAAPGLYFLVSPSFNPAYSPLASFANGMESPLSLLLFGGLLWQLCRRPEWERGLATPALLTAIALARLDDALLALAFAIVAARDAQRPREALRRAWHIAWLPAATIAAYLAYNLSYSGMALPVSGVAKSSGSVPGIVRNGYGLMTTLFPFFDPLGRGRILWSEQAWRIAQMVLPAAAALLWLVRARGEAQARFLAPGLRCATSAIALYVLLKAGYNFAFVGLWNQGHWYYPISIAAFSWMCALWLHEGLPRRDPTPRLRDALRQHPLACALVAAALVWVGADAGRYGRVRIESHQHAAYHRLWKAGPRIDAALDVVCPGCGLVEFDDGIFSASLSRPVMSGSGLALDLAAHRARMRGRLLDLAWERGFRLLASQYYALDDEAYASPESLREALPEATFLRGQDLSRWDFSVALYDEATGIHFVRFAPRAAPLRAIRAPRGRPPPR